MDQQKPKPEDLLEKIQSDMFSLRLIGGARGGVGGVREMKGLSAEV